jgi:uncharacterized protein YlxP (DUF503 family)
MAILFACDNQLSICGVQSSFIAINLEFWQSIVNSKHQLSLSIANWGDQSLITPIHLSILPIIVDHCNQSSIMKIIHQLVSEFCGTRFIYH